MMGREVLCGASRPRLSIERSSDSSEEFSAEGRASCARRTAEGGCPHMGSLGLRGQLLQNLFPQLLRLAEKFLILEEQPVQLQSFVGRWMLTQNHVTHMHGIGQGGIFGEFFQRRIGIIMVHAAIVAPGCEW